jgi:hypothetical protein
LGAVKLNKVLYFADMVRFAGTGSPLTGARYRKRPYGPTTDALLPVLRDLERESAIRIDEMDYFGYRKKVYIATGQADTSLLNPKEIELVNDIIEFVCYNNTAKTISELSHNKAWELAEFGAEIPYHTAFYLFPSIISEETIEWANHEVEQFEHDRAASGAELECSPMRNFQREMEEKHR